MFASLPMYPIYRDAVETLWSAIAAALRRRRLTDVPAGLTWPDNMVAHWRHPDLLLSQTCGYPLVTELAGAVRVLGAFRYTAPGCDGIRYRSVLVARSDDQASDIAAFRGRRAAYNSEDSQSGYNCLRALIAPLAVDGRFFGMTIGTGAHQASMQAVADGRADVAAIDCVSFAQIRAEHQDLRAALKVVGETASVPGLPLITRGSATNADVATLRDVLAEIVAGPALKEPRLRLMIGGFEPLEFEDYGEIIAMERSAIAAGYPVLA